MAHCLEYEPSWKKSAALLASARYIMLQEMENTARRMANFRLPILKITVRERSMAINQSAINQQMAYDTQDKTDWAAQAVNLRKTGKK